MSRLTVMQLLPALDSGGVERGTIEIGDAITAAGHVSLVVSAGGQLVPRLQSRGSRHIELAIGSKSPRVAFTIGKLARLITDNKVDILHARSRLPAWIGWRAMKKCNRPPLFITTLHGLHSVSHYSSIMTRGERIIAVSQTTRDIWLRNYPALEPHRITVINRGIDPSLYPYSPRPDPDQRARVCREFNLDPDKPLLVMPGRVTATKGQDKFINLIARLRMSGVPCHGLIVGRIKDRKSENQDNLEYRIEQLKMTDAVTFTDHRDDVLDLMAAADITYCLSRKPEAFGRTVIESLALGRPVLGFDHGGVSETLGSIFPEGRVPLNDEQALLARSIQFLEQPPVVPERHPYQLSTMQQQTISLYEDAVRYRHQDA